MRFDRFKARVSKVKQPAVTGWTNFNDPNRKEIDNLFEFSKNRIFFTAEQKNSGLTLEPSSQYVTGKFESGMKYSLIKFIMITIKKKFQITIGNHGFSSQLNINWWNKIICNCIHGRYIITREWYGRKIASACESDVAFMYLSCMYKPDFRTIIDFRKNNVDIIQQLFIEVLKLCQAMNMVNIGTLVIDSTKLRANASSRLSKTKGHYEQWLQNIEQQVKEVIEQADATDKKKDEKYGDTRVMNCLMK